MSGFDIELAKLIKTKSQLPIPALAVSILHAAQLGVCHIF